MILSSFDHLTLYLVLPQRRTGSFIKGILFKISRIFVFRETASSTDGALTRKLSRIFYRLFSFSFLHFSFFSLSLPLSLYVSLFRNIRKYLLEIILRIGSVLKTLIYQGRHVNVVVSESFSSHLR